MIFDILLCVYITPDILRVSEVLNVMKNWLSHSLLVTLCQSTTNMTTNNVYIMNNKTSITSYIIVHVLCKNTYGQYDRMCYTIMAILEGASQSQTQHKGLFALCSKLI